MSFCLSYECDNDITTYSTCRFHDNHARSSSLAFAGSNGSSIPRLHKRHGSESAAKGIRLHRLYTYLWIAKCSVCDALQCTVVPAWGVPSLVPFTTTGKGALTCAAHVDVSSMRRAMGWTRAPDVLLGNRSC